MKHATILSSDDAIRLEQVDHVTIRFAGDSGDGIQLTGTMFSHDSAISGHDISTTPDFPAEIRAPAGTLAGVSSFQLNFAGYDIHTPGDLSDTLIALNPAALKANLKNVKPGGTLILNHDGFNEAAFSKAGYKEDPREDGSLNGYQVFDIPITSLTTNAVKPVGLSSKQAEMCKNIFALGVVSWLYDRTLDDLEARIERFFSRKSKELGAANKLALQAGYNYADTVEVFTGRYQISKAKMAPGTYRRITGNEATALGFVAAAEISGRPLFYGSYPITPASDILHELSKLRGYGVRTFQAEDEIAAMGIAIGAAYGGSLALTGTSGPGIALKSEAIGLAVMAELPVVIVNVQRGGPSTGLPTKTEQSDLLQAMYGRNGECPTVVLAPATPSECFRMAIEAFRLATKYMTPVCFLSDGYIANGSEPWLLPNPEDLPEIDIDFPNAEKESLKPFQRNPKTLARPWIIPGTPGMEHRLGGLEKEDITGNVSYDSDNHEKMVRLRAQKIAGIAEDLPPLYVTGPDKGKLLVIGWGSSLGALRHAVENAMEKGVPVAATHLRFLNPFPANMGEILSRYENILVPELNLGQLSLLLKANFQVNVVGLNKVKGQPFSTQEIENKIYELFGVDHTAE